VPKIISDDYVPCTQECRAAETVTDPDGKQFISIKMICDHPLPLYEIDRPYGITLSMSTGTPPSQRRDPYESLAGVVAFKIQCQGCRRQFGAWDHMDGGLVDYDGLFDSVREQALRYLSTSGFSVDETKGCVCPMCRTKNGEDVVITAEHPVGGPLEDGFSIPASRHWFTPQARE
jgi:hypothetical protein